MFSGSLERSGALSIGPQSDHGIARSSCEISAIVAIGVVFIKPLGCLEEEKGYVTISSSI